MLPCGVKNYLLSFFLKSWTTLYNISAGTNAGADFRQREAWPKLDPLSAELNHGPDFASMERSFPGAVLVTLEGGGGWVGGRDR